MKSSTKKIVIIGGGITGLSSAYYLLKAGWEVDIIDKGDFKNNCSYVNAGMIVPSHFVPLAAPGVVSQGIRWLFNKRSPFYIKPAVSPRLVKWGKTFVQHANKEHVEASAPSILALNQFGKKQYENLHNSPEFNFSYQNEGILMLYRREKTKKEQIHEFEKARSLGMDCKVLTAAEIQELEPEVRVDVLGGVLYKTDAIIRPPQIMKEMLKAVRHHGATLYPQQEIQKVDVVKGHIKNIASSSRTFTGDQYLLATGEALSRLAKQAGLSIPVMPGKGYSFTTPRFAKKLRYPALLLEDKVSITPMGDEVRIGGTMELGVEDHKIKSYKLEGMVKGVNAYYPEIGLPMPNTKEVSYGFRPCSPDGLPYLGRSKKVSNLLLAGGGGMMGMSSGPAMGKIISEVAQNGPLSLEIDKFDPERFN